ncbi:MAG: hypothetical protein ACRC0F_09765 [Cetobacterium sp.]
MNSDLDSLLIKGRDFKLPLKKIFKSNKSIEILIEEYPLKKIEKKIEKVELILQETEKIKEESSKILFNKKENFEEEYIKLLTTLKNTEDFLKESANEEAEMYMNVLNQYKESIKRQKNKIKLSYMHEDEYSEEVTAKVISVVERDFTRLISSALKGERLKKSIFHQELRKKLENYLSCLNFYKKELDIEVNKHITEDCYKYMKISQVKTLNKDLNEYLKEIELEPYFLKYSTDDKFIAEYKTQGKVSIYIFKGDEE